MVPPVTASWSGNTKMGIKNTLDKEHRQSPIIITKADFSARPVYLQNGNQIKAHSHIYFFTCFPIYYWKRNGKVIIPVKRLWIN